MQRLEVSGAVRLIYGSLGVKRLIKYEFSRQIFKNDSISNFMQIRQVRSELFHTNARARTHTHTHKRTDTTKLTVHFRKFANASKNYQVPHITAFSHHTVDTSRLHLRKC